MTTQLKPPMSFRTKLANEIVMNLEVLLFSNFVQLSLPSIDGSALINYTNKLFCICDI